MAAQQQHSYPHHYGVTMLNLGLVSILQDRPFDALRELDEAGDSLEAGSASIEQASLFVLRAAVLAQIGRVDEADMLVGAALSRPDLRAEADLVLEAAEYEDSYGDQNRASVLLDEADSIAHLSAKHRWLRTLIGARYWLRRHDYQEAAKLLADIGATYSTSPGLGVSRLVDLAHLAAATSDPQALQLAEVAREASQNQRAHRSRRVADLLVAYSRSDESLSEAIASIGASAPWHITYLADLLTRRTSDASPDAIEVVHTAMQTHPKRWRQALRLQLSEIYWRVSTRHRSAVGIHRGQVGYPDVTCGRQVGAPLAREFRTGKGARAAISPACVG